MQVYAIPRGVTYRIIDPTFGGSEIMVYNVANESGQLFCRGFMMNARSSSNYLNFSLSPSESGFTVTPSADGITTDVCFFAAHQNDISIFQASNLPVDKQQTAIFAAADWDLLNETSISPITVQLYAADNQAAISAYSLTNGQSGLVPAQDTTLYLAVIIISIALVTVIAIIFKKRK
jgi:hypothetical protein